MQCICTMHIHTHAHTHSRTHVRTPTHGSIGIEKYICTHSHKQAFIHTFGSLLTFLFLSSMILGPELHLLSTHSKNKHLSSFKVKLLQPPLLMLIASYLHRLYLIEKCYFLPVFQNFFLSFFFLVFFTNQLEDFKKHFLTKRVVRNLINVEDRRL